ncbi:MAG: hypothetical protein ACLSEY_18515 [Enterocloster sp.]
MTLVKVQKARIGKGLYTKTTWRTMWRWQTQQCGDMKNGAAKPKLSTLRRNYRCS